MTFVVSLTVFVRETALRNLARIASINSTHHRTVSAGDATPS
jgi:hypothetical protein